MYFPKLIISLILYIFHLIHIGNINKIMVSNELKCSLEWQYHFAAASSELPTCVGDLIWKVVNIQKIDCSILMILKTNFFHLLYIPFFCVFFDS